jgi:hypothetical protein
MSDLGNSSSHSAEQFPNRMHFRLALGPVHENSFLLFSPHGPALLVAPLLLLLLLLIPLLIIELNNSMV